MSLGSTCRERVIEIGSRAGLHQGREGPCRVKERSKPGRPGADRRDVGRRHAAAWKRWSMNLGVGRAAASKRPHGGTRKEQLLVGAGGGAKVFPREKRGG